MSPRPARVSVVLCTYNPRPDLIAWTLTSIEAQTMAEG